MGLFKTITEGGQIWAHRIRLAKQVLKIATSLSLCFALVFFSYRLSLIPGAYYQALCAHLKAVLLDPPSDPSCQKHALIAGRQMLFDLTLALRHSSKIFFASLGYFLVKGWRSRQKQHLEGKRLVSPIHLFFRLTCFRRASPIRIGRIPLVKGTETQHILISGATGTGKTNAYHHLLPQIRRLRQRAIVVDTTGEYVEKYYRQGQDILLNPLDPRSLPWHPWCECTEDIDYKSLAQSFIPSSYREEENFWRKGAQEIFYCALREFAEKKSTAALAKLLLRDSLSTLSTVLQGTTASPYLDMSSEKTAGSVRAVATSFLECLELLPDTTSPFSIRDWISREHSDAWLFLNCTARQRASLIPLLTVWISTSISSLLQLSPSLHRRLWFIIDELPRLHRLKDLELFLTESRKFGGCGLLAIQSPSQLEAIYGRHATSTILGNCATRMAFAEYDPQTAKRISATFGDKEICESQESLSYGSHEMRDGVNLSFHHKTLPVVSPTAMQSLRPHEAFVKLPGTLPVAKIKLRHQTQ